MNELLDWLRQQKGGVRTYIEFQQRALQLSAARPDYAAALRLLSDLAARFGHQYDGEPLSVYVAERALSRLINLVEEAAYFKDLAPEDSLILLNSISQADLNAAVMEQESLIPKQRRANRLN